MNRRPAARKLSRCPLNFESLEPRTYLSALYSIRDVGSLETTAYPFSAEAINGLATNNARVRVASPGGPERTMGIYSYHRTESLVFDQGNVELSLRMYETSINNHNVVVGYRSSPGAGEYSDV